MTTSPIDFTVHFIHRHQITHFISAVTHFPTYGPNAVLLEFLFTYFEIAALDDIDQTVLYIFLGASIPISVGRT